jgi:hypothetical protein
MVSEYKIDVISCHSRKRNASGILQKKDSGQAGMTEKLVQVNMLFKDLNIKSKKEAR